MKHYFSMIIFIYLLTGCAMPSSPEGDIDNRVNLTGANQLLAPEFENFLNERKIISLLDPKHCGEYQQEKKGDTSHSNGSSKQNDHNASECVDNNNSKKEKKRNKLDKKITMSFINANKEGESYRTQIQDRLILSSTQRCNAYKSYIKSVDMQNNSIFSVLTAVLAGAGSIATHAASARTFSGLASMSAGTQSALRESLFQDIATNIIVPGIDLKREELLTKITNKRAKPIAEYTVERAMADAISYHGACSMAAGIDYAASHMKTQRTLIDNLKSDSIDIGVIKSILNISSSSIDTLYSQYMQLSAQNILDFNDTDTNDTNYKNEVIASNLTITKDGLTAMTEELSNNYTKYLTTKNLGQKNIHKLKVDIAIERIKNTNSILKKYKKKED